jgi:alpha-methylacyl-CoA racemase
LGVLSGIRVLELQGLGPGPFAAMMFSDMGASVTRICQPRRSDFYPPERDVLARGRRSVTLDLRHPKLRDLVMEEIVRSDVLIDPFRPGAAERIGLGPDVCLEQNPRLVYGRITGWGQAGPYANRVGHDLNYAGVAGALHGIGRKGEPPPPPLNLIGDFGGGGMLLVTGVLAALYERERSGLGQVVDAAMVDGVAQLMASICGFSAMGLWTDERESNLLDGGAHFYACYETADEKFLSVAPIEDRFYMAFLAAMELRLEDWPKERRDRWPLLHQRLSAIFRSRPIADWLARLEHVDGCCAPVLTLREAFEDPHLHARGTYVSAHGVTQPAPAPRFSRTPSEIQGPPSQPGEDTVATLRQWGLDPADIEDLVREGAAARNVRVA